MLAAGLAGAFLSTAIRRLLVERLWLDVAVNGLRRYFHDADTIDGKALVLDIGSGDRPHIRADIICDKFGDESWERTGTLLRDRPLVVGDITALPFRDKTIDYVICQHVMEHMADPEGAFREMERVGKAGLVRTPSPVAEMLVSRDIHRWLVSTDGTTLLLRQKDVASLNPELDRVFAVSSGFWHFFGQHIDLMETTYRWTGRIGYRVERLEHPRWDGEHVPIEHGSFSPPSQRVKLRQVATKLLGHAYRRTLHRPREIEWDRILACPSCGGAVGLSESTVTCADCRRKYPVRNGVPIMLLEESFAEH